MEFFIDDVPRVQLFGIEHFFYIGFAVLAVVWFISHQTTIKKNQISYHRLFLWITLVTTIVFYTWSLIFTGFALTNGLPLHACRISTLVSLYFYFTKDSRVIPFLFYSGFFALFAILYPSNVHPLYTHLVGYTAQITHIMILMNWLYIVLILGYRPTIKDMNQTALVFIAMLLLIWPFNYLVGGGEYFYIISEVNRPFLKELPDILFLSIMFGLFYIVMMIKTAAFDPVLRSRLKISQQ